MEEEKEIKSQIVINDEIFTALRLKMGIANKKYFKSINNGNCIIYHYIILFS